jgi:hypothetical protein
MNLGGATLDVKLCCKGTPPVLQMNTGEVGAIVQTIFFRGFALVLHGCFMNASNLSVV